MPDLSRHTGLLATGGGAMISLHPKPFMLVGLFGWRTALVELMLYP
jgi:hypothetical protein